MKISVLGSGSSGNCIYVENGDKAFLIDAGLSGRDTERRLEFIGRKIWNVDAIIITHDHSDHTKGAGILCRKYKIPLIIEKKSYRAIKKYLGKIPELFLFDEGASFEIGSLTVETIKSDHDSASSVCLNIRNCNKNFGVFTDLGIVNESIKEVFPFLDGAVLEFNHDIDMLKNGPYPDYLKRRIAGRYGHLSNYDASFFLKRYMGSNFKKLFLAHLSEHNNTPECAYLTLQKTMRGCKKFKDIDVIMTSRRKPTPLISL